jgi:hypothetical protein
MEQSVAQILRFKLIPYFQSLRGLSNQLLPIQCDLALTTGVF